LFYKVDPRHQRDFPAATIYQNERGGGLLVMSRKLSGGGMPIIPQGATVAVLSWGTVGLEEVLVSLVALG
jgi:hypothetical protein